MEGNGDTPYFRHALENYMRYHGLEACDPCSLPAYILTGLLREAEERRAHHEASSAARASDRSRVAQSAGTVTVTKM